MSQKRTCDIEFDVVENPTKRVKVVETSEEKCDGQDTVAHEEEDTQPEELRVRVLKKCWADKARSRMLKFIKYQRTLKLKRRFPIKAVRDMLHMIPKNVYENIEEEF
ncbi:hypothetical protein GWI33_003757 [Rhynchophorus ferrugineus]|uniref:Uncharacterized protein n=1 Tax=Rhynchophorus ferrugineus TaxID=354439 RepID=A0A834M0W0_RHYFE|nr:hypothetical protein GWI33_003757 [Rhynchophorus ferrugineus]